MERDERVNEGHTENKIPHACSLAFSLHTDVSRVKGDRYFYRRTVGSTSADGS